MYSSEFQAIIDRRRSNRRFDPLVEVPDEVIKRSIERAILSPNSSNMQLWEFYWIKSDELKLALVPLFLQRTVPKGKSEADNELIRSGGELPQLSEGAMPHWDLGTK